MKKFPHYFTVFLSLLAPIAPTTAVHGQAAAPRRIAILDVRSYDGKNDRGRLVRDMLEVAFYRAGSFEILERNRIDIIMRERGLAAGQCYDLDCAVRVGKVLSLDYAVIGSIGSADKPQVTVRIIDVKKGSLAHADTKTAAAESDIEGALSIIVENAMAHYSEGIFSVPRPRRAGTFRETLESFTPALIPGLYQVKHDHAMKGYAIMGAFTASLLYSGYTLQRYRESRAAYDDLGFSDPWRTYEDAYARSERDFRRMNLALGITAALYICNFIDAVYFTDTRGEKSALTLEFNGAAGYCHSDGRQPVKDNRWQALVHYRFDFSGLRLP